MKYFHIRRGNLSKKVDIYFFFVTRNNLDLSKDIEDLVELWHKKYSILSKNKQNWYYPNPQKKELNQEILQGKWNGYYLNQIKKMRGVNLIV